MAPRNCRRRPSTAPIGVTHAGVGKLGSVGDAVQSRTARHSHHVDGPPAACARGALRHPSRPSPSAAPRAPPPRADHAVPPGAAARGQLHCPHRGQHRGRAAALHHRRIRRLPRMRHPGARLSEAALRRVRPRQAAGLQLQAARLLPVVRCAPDAADGGAPGGPLPMRCRQALRQAQTIHRTVCVRTRLTASPSAPVQGSRCSPCEAQCRVRTRRASPCGRHRRLQPARRRADRRT